MGLVNDAQYHLITNHTMWEWMGLVNDAQYHLITNQIITKIDSKSN